MGGTFRFRRKKGLQDRQKRPKTRFQKAYGWKFARLWLEKKRSDLGVFLSFSFKNYKYRDLRKTFNTFTDVSPIFFKQLEPVCS